MAWWSPLPNPTPQGGRGLQTHSLHKDSKSPPPLRVKVREGGAYRFLISFIVALLISSFAHAADKVRLSYVLSSVEYADDFLAIDKGYFKEEGIDIDLQQAGGGAAVPALISGDIDFTGSGSVAISAILKGAKLKVLLVVDAHPAMQIWAQPAVKSFADLKGKPIGIISRADTIATLLKHGQSNAEAIGTEYDNLIDSLTDTGTMPKDAQALDVSLRSEMLNVPKDKVPPPEGVFDFSFAEKALAQLKAAHWQPPK
jgi:hypothetical protein